jgi:hypothetical protein
VSETKELTEEALPNREGVCGTLSGREGRTWMALFACSGLASCTKPKPRLWPVILSMITEQSSTCPNGPTISRSRSLVMEYGSPATYN